MRMWRVASGLVIALAISSSASSRIWSSPALQHVYFAKVAQISRGVVRPLRDENSAILNYRNAIFEVDLEGNGSKYIASYGKAMVDIRSIPPGVEISHLLEDKPSKVISKGEIVILILNSRTGRLTIMPNSRGDSIQIRPLRWKGKDRHIPDDVWCRTVPQDRDAVSFGDSGTNVLIYRDGKGWKLHWCEVA